jgi:Zn-dependent alcohol dehydrogenase
MNNIINRFKNIDSIYFTRSYSLKEINLAISDMRRGIVIRPLIKMF